MFDYSSSLGFPSSALMLSQYFAVALGILGDLLYPVLILLFEVCSLICFGACFGDMYLFCVLVSTFVFLLLYAGSFSATASFLLLLELFQLQEGCRMALLVCWPDSVFSCFLAS